MVRVRFDPNGNIEDLTLVLAYRSGEKIATFNDVQDLRFTESLGNPPEFSFTVTKSLANSYWKEIKDFRLMWVAEWDDWYEISVELNEADSSTKSISATHLPEAELSQLNLYATEINTEDDIDASENASIFFNPDSPEESVLHRVLSKAVNFTISNEIPTSLRNFKRTLEFSFDGTSIYDALAEIAEEVQCLFEFQVYTGEDGQIVRQIKVHDLQSYCLDCGHRDEFHNTCPECGSTNIEEGFGEDTPAFWSTDNACDEITYTTDVGSVKNCFKLEAGDDDMTAAIKQCNPNGSNLIWYISEDMRKNELSEELAKCLDSYDELYNKHVKEIEYNISVTEFNKLVNKYSANKDAHGEEIWTTLTVEPAQNPVKGYSALIDVMWNAKDMQGYLTSELLPCAEKMPEATSIEEEMANLKSEITSVAVNGVFTNSTVTNAVSSMAKVVIDSRYTVKVDNGTLNGNVWSGEYTVTSNSDKTVTLTENTGNITVSTNYEEFVKEKIDKTLGKSDDTDYSITGLFELSNTEFAAELKKYGTTPLEGISNSCSGVLSVLTDLDVDNNQDKADIKEEIYDSYYAKDALISAEMAEREKELLIIQDLLDQIDTLCAEVQKTLNFEEYVKTCGENDSLWKELSSFRREDVYSNSNYISDNLSSSEMIALANEFVTQANKEIIKSATLQHSISTSLKNIFAIESFRPILDQFKIGNWIRIGVDDQVYKLRLISYELDFTNYESISVEFSDVTQVGSDLLDVENAISNIQSMATSYAFTQRQASKGEESYSVMDNWGKVGLDATLTKIMNGADNQTQTWDEKGMLFRKKKEFLDEYEDEQMKIINSTIAITKDNWKTISTAIGKIYYAPDPTKPNELEYAYGINGEVIAGKLFIGQNLKMYNTSGSLTFDENGFIVRTYNSSTGVLGDERMKIDSNGDITLRPKNLIVNTDDGGYIDIKSKNFTVTKDGNVTISGVITASSGAIGGWQANSDTLYSTLASSRSGMCSNSSKYAFWAGETNSSYGAANTNAKFRVGHNGNLVATSANISGDITANTLTTVTGNIGCWKFDQSRIYDTTYSAGINKNGSGQAFWAGGNDLTGGSAPFRVNHAGYLYATDANIIGTIKATEGSIGGLNVTSSYDNSTHIYANSLYYQSKNIPLKMYIPYGDASDNNFIQGSHNVDVEYGMKTSSKETDLLFYARTRPTTDSTWDINKNPVLFSVNTAGLLTCLRLRVMTTYAIQLGRDGVLSTSETPYSLETGEDGIILNEVSFSESSIRSHMVPYGNYNLGSSDSDTRWKNIYLKNSPNVSSDRNVKKDIKELSDIHRQFFMKLIPVSFMYTSANSDRTHIGFIAQDVEQAMKECGLTSLDFAGFCKDIKKERISTNPHDKRTREVYDENGNPVYTYSLRYTEFIAIITYVLQDNVNRLDKLEKLVNQLISG